MAITAFILSLCGLLGFVGAVCAVVYFFWRKPTDKPLPSGLYRIKVIGRNPRTGIPIYDVELVEEEKGVGCADEVRTVVDLMSPTDETQMESIHRTHQRV